MLDRDEIGRQNRLALRGVTAFPRGGSRHSIRYARQRLDLAAVNFSAVFLIIRFVAYCDWNGGHKYRLPAEQPRFIESLHVGQVAQACYPELRQEGFVVTSV